MAQGVLKLDRWEDWDQSTVIPAKFRGDYSQWAFPTHGKCSDYGYAHQYGGHFERMFETPRGSQVFYDVSGKSCLNGWAMGNVASTGLQLAKFFRDVYSPNGNPKALLNASKTSGDMLRVGIFLDFVWLTTRTPHGAHVRRAKRNRINRRSRYYITAPLQASTVAKMKKTNALTNKWCPGCQYGLAAFQTYQQTNPFYSYATTQAFGHAGADWGSGAPLCAYFTNYDFSLCVVMNSAYGMDCSPESPESWVTDFAAAGRAAGCNLLNQIVKASEAALACARARVCVCMCACVCACACAYVCGMGEATSSSLRASPHARTHARTIGGWAGVGKLSKPAKLPQPPLVSFYPAGLRGRVRCVRQRQHGQYYSNTKAARPVPLESGNPCIMFMNGGGSHQLCSTRQVTRVHATTRATASCPPCPPCPPYCRPRHGTLVVGHPVVTAAAAAAATFQQAAPLTCEFKDDYPICDVCDHNICYGWRSCTKTQTGDCAKFYAKDSMLGFCVDTCSARCS